MNVINRSCVAKSGYIWTQV